MYALRLLFFILHIVDIFTDLNFLISASNVPRYWKLWMGFFTFFPMIITLIVVGECTTGFKAIFGLYVLKGNVDEEIVERDDTLKSILIIFENVPQFILQTMIMLAMGGNLSFL
jgi:hypothetical protein